MEVCVCVCVPDILPPAQHHGHILKVTNQARWPFGKIKDTFLKKETSLIYHADSCGDLCNKGAALRGYEAGIWADTQEVLAFAPEPFYMLGAKMMVVKAKEGIWGGKDGKEKEKVELGRKKEAECK